MNKQINITFCMTQFITGGIEKSLVQLLEKSVKNQTYHFSILVKTPNVEEQFTNFCQKNGIDLQIIPYQLINYKKDSVSNVKKFLFKSFNCIQKIRIKHFLKQYLKKQNLVIDYFNCSFSDLLVGIDIPKIGWYHSGYDQYAKKLQYLNNKYLKLYNNFVVITKSFETELLKTCSAPNKVKQIYNPFDIEKIQNMASETLSLELPDKYFVFVGRLDRDKDHKTVIYAFEQIALQFPDVTLLFVGDGNTQSYYKKYVQDKNLTNRVLFIGNVENPYVYIKHALANILSSPSEGLSNVLVEGAILGTLNIASDCPSGPAEILLKGKGGVLYPVGDSSALANVMRDVLTNKIKKDEIIKTASQNIYRFDAENIARQFMQLCQLTIKKQTKIGILNFFFENENYGAVLTAYALNKYLSDMGYEAKNINYVANFYKGRNVKDCSNFEEFKSKNLPLTSKVSANQLKKLNKDFNVFVVGSDQVFRHRFVKKEKGIYYLSFVDRKNKKIAYAASFGTSKFDGKTKDIKKVGTFFKNFNAISVRESDGVKILNDTFHVKGIQVLDPVFLIDWAPLLSDFKYQETVYYILNPDLQKLTEKNMLGSSLTIENWLSAIKNSNLVITDSFHALCFCILFKKKFVALAHRNSPISRLYSLFDMFSLPKDKIVFNDMVEGKQNLEDFVIEIANIDEVLMKWRKISYDFILQAIGE